MGRRNDDIIWERLTIQPSLHLISCRSIPFDVANGVFLCLRKVQAGLIDPFRLLSRLFDLERFLYDCASIQR
jgi:hypothetical protein